VIDVLDELIYVKYQKKHDVLLLCNENEAQGILSSDKNTAYHISTCNKFPVDKYLNVSISEIDEHEYKTLKLYNLSTPEDIIDNYTMELIERGVL
jgi:hypothetical protein